MNKEQIMTPADVLKWAREASADHEVRWSEDDLQTVAFFFQFARLAYEAGAEAMKEECAIVAWSHYMDECKRQRVNPAVHEKWLASSAIRARGQLKESP